MAVSKFPEIYKILYRGVRTAVAAGIVQMIAIPNWQAAPERTLLVAFGSGFLVALGMWARDMLDKWFDFDEKSLIAKVLPI